MTEHRDPSSIGEGTFISTLLAPGSSLNPTFLLILDGSFALLLAVLLLLLWLSSMSLHVAALIAIEVGLWVSVKWFIHELQIAQRQDKNTDNDTAGKDNDE